MIRIIRTHIYKVLRWSERYTKTDMVYLTKGGFWITSGRVISGLIGFISTIAFAHFLSKDDFGTYKFILSFGGILTSLTLTGMSTSITQAVARGFEGVLKSGLLIYLRWALIPFFASLIIAGYYVMNDNLILATGIVLVGIFTPLSQGALLYSAFLTGKKDFAGDMRLGIWNSILPNAAIIIVMMLTTNPLIIVGAFLISGCATAFALYSAVTRRYKPNTSTDPAFTKNAKHLSLMNVLGGISFNIDKILMFHYLGPVSLATYSYAMAPAQQLRYLGKVLSTMALPKLSGVEPKTIKKTLPYKALLLLVASIMLAGIYVLFAPYIYKIFFPQYLDAITFSQIFALILIFLPSNLFQQAITAHMETKALYIIQTTIPVLKIILLPILIPMFGIIGAFIPMFVAEITRLVLVIYFFTRMKGSLSLEKTAQDIR